MVGDRVRGVRGAGKLGKKKEKHVTAIALVHKRDFLDNAYESNQFSHTGLTVHVA